MKEIEPWERFWVSGKIEDYLHYTGTAEQPEVKAADMVAMNNAVELSGIGGIDTFGMNNLAAMARQDEINGHSSVRGISDPME